MPNSNVPTLDASNLTYEFENVRVNQGATDNNVLQYVEKYSKKKLPPNLQYLDDFHDDSTGTSGTAFLDKDSGEVIIAYTGTNPNADIVKDVATDIGGIIMAFGYHYDEAFKFYERIRQRYGDNITLTGHSLGGNIAQRVALEYNAPRTVVYNSAPLYLEGLIESKDRIIDYLTPWDSAREKIINKEKTFTGQVVRIRTQDDFLNNISMPFLGVYLGEDYLLENSGGHNIDPDITGDKNQINQIKDILEKQSPEKMTGLEKKNYETLKKLQGVKNGLLKQLNTKFLSDGSISSHEMFFLDSVQATAVAMAMTESVSNGHSEIEAVAKKAVTDAETLYDKSKEVPWFVTELTNDEIEDVYVESGVTYDSIVGETQRHFDKKVSKSAAIVKAFTDLESNIQKGVEQAVEGDESLARDINQWTN
jgi:hypothetical protein